MKSSSIKLSDSILTIISMLLILLWAYTAFSKLADVDDFKRQLGNQTLGKTAADFLFWFIPISEITAVLLLLFLKTRIAGLILSAFLLTLFTGYIILVLLGYFDRIPCSCGGVLKEMGWHMHLWFNVFFLGISALGIYLSKNELTKSY